MARRLPNADCTTVEDRRICD